MSIVILAEKPSQGKAYAEAFHKRSRKDGYIEVSDSRLFNGKQTFITWGFGHLIELARPEDYKTDWKQWSLASLPILPNEYKFQVSKNSGIKKQYNSVKKLLDQSTLIVVASDADREGENIARSIIKQAGADHKPIKRLWINSLETDEIRKGFQNLKDGKDYELFYKEAQTRQISDWIVGMNTSRLYTLLLQQKGLQGVFSCGRVQSPTLYQIFKRQAEIEDFKPSPFYEIIGDVSVENGKFIAKHDQKFTLKDDVQKLLADHDLQEGTCHGSIKNVEQSLKRQQSPKLHSLSTLQTKANKQWKYSPSDVLKIVQDLYEKKLLSYPRTDTQFITESEFNYLKNNLHSYKQCLNIDFEEVYTDARKRYVNGENVQEHYAIIPTREVATLSELTEKERNIYVEVMRTSLAMFADDYQYEETKVEVDVQGIILFAKGNVPIKQGWKDLFGHSVDENKKSDPTLPKMKTGESCEVDMNVKESMTSPPKPYTEGGLINMMKNAGRDIEDQSEKEMLKKVEGIGTEATRASVIETLKKQQYIEVKKNIVQVTPKGVVLCNVLDGTLLASPTMTAKWEQYLTKIGKGEGSQEKFLDSIKKFVLSTLDDAPKNIEKNKALLKSTSTSNSVGNCPSCDNGLIDDKGKFYGCNNYRNGCKFTLPKKLAQKTLTKSNISDLLTKGKTTKIKGFKSNKGKSFDAFLVLKDGKTVFEFGQK